MAMSPGGSALLYRLLAGYPTERLQIIEGNISPPDPPIRIPAVAYHRLGVGSYRILHTRLARPYAALLHLTAPGRLKRLHGLVEAYRPQAVLTVIHGYSWLTAAKFAAKNRLPLHVIVHDDWPNVNMLPGYFQSRVDRDFGRVYRQASERYCVSPYMAEEYRTRYGVDGKVVYPSRPPDSNPFEGPPARLAHPGKGITVVFAGSLHVPDYLRMLSRLATALRACNGSLQIHAPPARQLSERFEAFKDVVDLLPLIPESRLVGQLRERADVLFLPMTFEENSRTHMRTSFPSKLTEYTAAGVPILIWGPPYCSAVRWARENPGVAEVLDENDVEQLANRLRRLASDADYRIRLGGNALRIGRQYFSHAAAAACFYRGITRSPKIQPTSGRPSH